jgi:hypothetical protein
MFDRFYVGHFDPASFLNTSEEPFKPKVFRPLAQEKMECALARNPEIREYVSDDDVGFVKCGWPGVVCPVGLQVYRFAFAIAKSENAVIMDGPPCWLITYPKWAQRMQDVYGRKYYTM